MIDEKYIELMNREIDNLITNEEKIRLDYYLAENKEAKVYFEELQLTNSYLNRINDPVPSENLKKRIINAIDFSRYTGRIIHHSKFNFTRIFNFKYTVTFAMGLLVGIFIYSLFTLNSDNISTEEVSGTIGTPETAVVLEDIPFNFPCIKGKIEMTARGQNFWLNINSMSAIPVDLIITYPDQVQFENIKPGNSPDIRLSRDKNIIKTTISGSQDYSVMFKKITESPSPVHVRILRAGKQIYEYEFSLKR